MKIFNKSITFNFIKDNLTIILLIPTIIGGVWQLLELFFIGTPYIRFFSITQLVPDGILIMVILLLIGIVCSKFWEGSDSIFDDIFYIYKKQDVEQVVENIEQTQIIKKERAIIKVDTAWMKKRDGYIMIGLHLVCLVGLSAFILPEILMPIRKGYRLPLMVFIAIFFFITFYTGMIIRIIIIILDIHKSRLNPKSNFIKNMIGWIAMITVLSAFFVSIYLIAMFHKSVVFPEGFKNITYLECLIKTNNPQNKSFQVLYFNDKYIFVEIEVESKRYIEAIKFEDFTNGDACNKNSTN